MHAGGHHQHARAAGPPAITRLVAVGAGDLHRLRAAPSCVAVSSTHTARAAALLAQRAGRQLDAPARRRAQRLRQHRRRSRRAAARASARAPTLTGKVRVTGSALAATSRTVRRQRRGRRPTAAPAAHRPSPPRASRRPCLRAPRTPRRAAPSCAMRTTGVPAATTWPGSASTRGDDAGDVGDQRACSRPGCPATRAAPGPGRAAPAPPSASVSRRSSSAPLMKFWSRSSREALEVGRGQVAVGLAPAQLRRGRHPAEPRSPADRAAPAPGRPCTAAPTLGLALHDLAADAEAQPRLDAGAHLAGELEPCRRRCADGRPPSCAPRAPARRRGAGLEQPAEQRGADSRREDGDAEAACAWRSMRPVDGRWRTDGRLLTDWSVI